MYGNYYGGYPQQMYGAVPDTLGQYKAQYQMPQQMQQTPQSSNDIQWVQGEAGAKSYIVAPGRSAMLMDSEAQVFYIKTTDVSGVPMPLRIFDYSERMAQPAEAPAVISTEKYVTRDEFEKLMKQFESFAEKMKEDTENA